MTLKAIIERLSECAKLEPNVNAVYYNDVYQLNTIPNAEYSCVVISQDSHNENEDTIDYGFYLFYVDRLIDVVDGYNNQIDIQSRGIVVLRDIINRFNGIDENTIIQLNYTITPFNERFKDMCSGVYAKITITSETIGDCAY